MSSRSLRFSKGTCGGWLAGLACFERLQHRSRASADGCHSGDRGTAGLLLVVGGVVLVGAALVAGALVAGALAHTRAQSAADAVALAVGAGLLQDADPCAGGAEVAHRNDAELQSCELGDGGVTVAVAVRLPPVLTTVTGRYEAHARARAELEYSGPSPVGG